MKRGFEENVPKVRPRVRLGRALDEQFAEAQEVAAAESIEPPVAPVMPQTDVVPRPPPVVVQEAPVEKPRRKPAAVIEIAGLARELTAELQRAAEVNAKLKADLDAALTGLQRAADESRDQREELERLQAELETKAASARDLHGELELLEAERDGALAQVARLTRELREEKARGAKAADEARRAREEANEAVAAAQAQADEALESRKALEDLHKALSDARGRISSIR